MITGQYLRKDLKKAWSILKKSNLFFYLFCWYELWKSNRTLQVEQREEVEVRSISNAYPIPGFLASGHQMSIFNHSTCFIVWWLQILAVQSRDDESCMYVMHNKAPNDASVLTTWNWLVSVLFLVCVTQPRANTTMNFHFIIKAGGYVGWLVTPSCGSAWFDPGQPYQPLSPDTTHIQWARSICCNCNRERGLAILGLRGKLPASHLPPTLLNPLWANIKQKRVEGHDYRNSTLTDLQAPGSAPLDRLDIFFLSELS